MRLMTSFLEDKRYRDLQDSIDESRTLVEELTLALMCENVELRALARDAANSYLERLKGNCIAGQVVKELSDLRDNELEYTPQ